MSEVTSDSTPVEPPQNKPGLNIQDLVNVLQVINTCTQRGAFRADELSGVGGLYDRLNAFVQSTGVLKENNVATSATSATE